MTVKSPEKSLWIAVVVQEIRDAKRADLAPKKLSKNQVWMLQHWDKQQIVCAAKYKTRKDENAAIDALLTERYDYLMAKYDARVSAYKSGKNNKTPKIPSHPKELLRCAPARYAENIDRDNARSWLLSNSSDFRDVCDLAGFDPDCVLAGARILAANGWSDAADIKEAAE